MARVLVVDDEPKLGKLTAEMLALDGHAVVRAGGGREALAELAGQAFDVVVTDLRMPEVDGLAVLGAARGLAHSFAGIDVQIDMPALRVQADPGRLRQVFVNLLANAGQAGARNLEVLGRATDGVARVEIRDDGPGIPADVRSRLFDPFATGRRGGTGLGLAISRRIVERHGGVLGLLDDHRPGAAFELRLPLVSG